MATELYVCVGSEDDPLCPIWKLWTQGNEFYAQQSDGNTLWKLSVHASGICRLAQVDRTAPAAITAKLDKDPHVFGRWNIPAIGSAEPTMCFSIMVPSVYVGPRDGFQDLPVAKRVNRAVLARAAPIGSCTDIDSVRLTDPEGTFADREVLGVLDLRDGSKIWVMRSERKLTAESFANFQQHMSEAVFSHDGPADAKTYGHLAVVARSHAYPAIWDMSFGRYNMPSTTS